MTTPTLSRRALLGGMAALAAPTAVFGGAPARSLFPQARPAGLIKRALPTTADLIAKARLDGPVALALVNAADGRVMEARGADVALPPASVLKVVTALYALEALGPAFRFETRVLGTGPVVDGRLEGDLILAGGGDPTFDTDAAAELAAALKEAGLREITGRFLLWEGALPYQPSIDAAQLPHLGYNPAISGLNLNYNRVHFEWRRQGGDYDITMDARSARYRPDVTVARMRVADRAGPVYTYADAGGHDDWSVARGALGGGGARWLPVRKPALYAGEVFSAFARAHGIVLPAAELMTDAPTGETIARHSSAPLREILFGMLKYSTNLTAEAVGLMASAARSGRRPGGTLTSAAEMALWARESLGLDGAAFVDHSGLGDRSRLQAAPFARMLARPEIRAALDGLLKPFDLRDAAEIGPPMQVRAKTGTLDFVNGLGGYLTAPDGTLMSFAVFSANPEARAAAKARGDEVPPGARGWSGRARGLQRALLARWGVLHGV
ncbi:D-alanyl-D-alanine carboxypeptidase/D-alanyl-D-alanine endopeptidase [Poseidonocella sedimentorum]|nr:D-alanyl-D-alanine carboxypeptidase/D-alanyl-D-alanine-endopeptidase [Poseidonocella sedimentorum]